MSHRLDVGGPARLWGPVEAGLTVALLLVGLLGLFFWRMTQQRAEEADWLAHNREVFTSLELTLTHLLDAETGARGFALTGNEPFLEPYESGKHATSLDLKALGKLIVDEGQAKRFQVLAQQAESVLEADGGLAATRQMPGTAPTVDEVAQSKQRMDAVRATVLEMEAEQKRLLKQHSQRARRSRRFTTFALWLSGILGFFFLSISGITALRAVRTAARTEVRVKALNTELTGRVGRSGQALEAQKVLIQSVLNSMAEGLVAADEHGKLILCNPAAQKILGLCGADFSPADWAVRYGAFLPDMITPFPNEQNPLLRAIRGEVSSAVIFFRTPALDLGAWIESNGAPLRDKEGRVRGGVIAFRDITRGKANELEIRELNQDLEARIAERTSQLETANHELGAFSYSVSHDLRAPLRHIGGFARILLRDFGQGMEPEARDHLQLIEAAVLRMGLLVDGLLSLATLGRQSLQLRRTELNAIVDEVVSLLQPECEGRVVEWQIAPLPALECDPILIGQVFQNLLGNALKYSRGRPGAFIEVGSFQEPGEPAVIFVRDNGAGFNMKYAEKLFGVFQRMHTESEFEGTGVGLATVHRIIQKHGGTVWAEAEPDRGATFYFTLSGKEQVWMARNPTSTSSRAVRL
jgi:signal transduction histidine kinase